MPPYIININVYHYCYKFQLSLKASFSRFFFFIILLHLSQKHNFYIEFSVAQTVFQRLPVASSVYISVGYQLPYLFWLVKKEIQKAYPLICLVSKYKKAKKLVSLTLIYTPIGEADNELIHVCMSVDIIYLSSFGYTSPVVSTLSWQGVCVFR